MATYTPVPKSVPSDERSAQITAVAAGDQIDLIDVLGRPARQLQFVMTDSADTIDYTLNSLQRIRNKRTAEESFSKTDQVFGTFGTTVTEVWRTGGEGFPSYQSTGSAVLETTEGLKISSVDIEALSLSSGSTITIIAW